MNQRSHPTQTAAGEQKGVQKEEWSLNETLKVTPRRKNSGDLE